MGAGLQIVNDSGSLQIDGLNQHMVLLRKGTISTASLYYGRVDMPSSYGTVAQNSNELLAIQAPGIGHSIAGRYNGTTTVYFLGTGAGAAVPYWIFGPYVPSGENYGMELFGEDGTPIWDTGRPPMRVAGSVSGLGSFTVGQAGRNYALVTVNQYGQIERGGASGPVNGGSPTNSFLSQTFSSGYGGISGQTVSTSNNTTLGGVWGPYSAGQIPAGWTGTWTNNQQNTFSVIDVTNY